MTNVNDLREELTKKKPLEAKLSGASLIKPFERSLGGFFLPHSPLCFVLASACYHVSGTENKERSE